MAESTVLERIRAWEADGVIDSATADRLVALESGRNTVVVRQRPATALAGIFGPGIAVGEMFGYVGGGFLLAAWYALVDRMTSTFDLSLALGVLIAGAALLALGLVTRGGSARLARAAGVAFLLAAAHVGVGVYVLLSESLDAGLHGRARDISAVAGAAFGLLAGAALRRIHPALTTQLALIGGVIALAAAIMQWLEPILFESRGVFDPTGSDSAVRPILIAIGWGVTAVVLGFVGLREARLPVAAAGARAGLTRLAAGLTAIIGTATAVFASGSLGGDEYGRLIPPVVGDTALIVVSAILLERAFRREASAFVYPAALGVIIGLSDLNANYLAAATSTEVALLVEGVILLGAGLVFDRLRRRLGRAVGASEAAANPAPVSAA